MSDENVDTKYSPMLGGEKNLKSDLIKRVNFVHEALVRVLINEE